MKKQETTFGWHLVGATLRDGSAIPRDGAWLPKIENIKLCERGYHGSLHPFDALKYAPGETLCYCEYRGQIFHGSDKFVAEQRRIVTRMDATEMLRYYARMQAVSVVHLWDAQDVVLDYLMTGEEQLRASAQASARDSAWDSARDSVRASVRASVQASAWASAWASVRDDFATLVYECFGIKEGEK